MGKTLKICLILYLLSFLIYNLNFSSFYTSGKGDTTPSRLLPFNLFSGHGFYFDEFIKLYPLDPDSIYFFQKPKDHYVSSYPFLPGLVSTPIYLPFYIFLNQDEKESLPYLFNLSFTLEKISASIFASLNVVLFFLLIFKLSQSIKTGIIFSLIFAFATQTFSISSQYLWQHGVANLFMTVSLLFLISGIEAPVKNRKTLLFILSLVASIFSLWTRQSFFIFSLTLFFIICLLDKRKIGIYLFSLTIGIFIFFGYNIYFYNSLLGGYGSSTINALASGSFLDNFTGLLFSPARGAIFYVPIFILAMASIFFLKKVNYLPKLQKSFFYINFVNLFGIILLNSFWGVWWGGHSWGSRLLTDAAVSATILVYFLYVFNKSILFKVILTVIVIYSVIVQAIGIFYYPRAFWDYYPNDVNNSPDRLWSFKDNPIIRNLTVGPQFQGIYNFINLSKSLKNKEYTHLERKCSLKFINKKSFWGYEVLELYFQNNSSVDWHTTGIYGYRNLNLRQVFISKDGLISTESPITPILPRIIKSGQKIKVNLIAIPPNKDNYEILVFPTQEGISSWISSCKLVISND